MLDQCHVGRDAGDAEPVSGRGDDARDVRAVAVVVLAYRVDAAGNSHGPSMSGMSVREVAGQRQIEVWGEVRVTGVDAAVDDADSDAPAPRLFRVRVVGAHHGHVPLQTVERFGAGCRRYELPVSTGCCPGALLLDRVAFNGGVRHLPDRAVGGCADQFRRGDGGLGEGACRLDREHADVVVAGNDRPAGPSDRRGCGSGADPVVRDDRVVDLLSVGIADALTGTNAITASVTTAKTVALTRVADICTS